MTGVHVFPFLNPLSHLPPCTIPLGHPSAPAPRILYPASNLDWRFVSYMILYMFQCHSPKMFQFYVCEVTQLCLTLCDPVDCSPPGSSVHGILQARILEWVAISFSRGSSRPRDQTCVFCISRQILFLFVCFFGNPFYFLFY